jgi:hypothetical protein
MGSATIPMASQTYIGLAVTSHNPSAVTAATYSNVTLTGGLQPGSSIKSLATTGGAAGTAVFGTSGIAEGTSAAATVAAPTVEALAVGLGQSAGGPLLQMRGGASAAYAVRASLGSLLSGYDLGGEYHVAVGDIDGDGLDEIVVGFGQGGMGWLVVLDDARHNYAVLKWIQIDWASYNAANGTVYPAVGDIDGDGRAEIVAGLGTGGNGFYQIFDDAQADFKSLGWGQANFGRYSSVNGEIHPAVGDVDGDGRAEIILGFGTGGAGLLQIVKYTAAGVVPDAWLRAGWSSYNAANGATWPAVGDLNADGLAEIVVGLGEGSNGMLEEFDNASNGFAVLNWIQVGGDRYVGASGETHPAIGNLDGDSAAELVIGVGASPGNDGWLAVLDDAIHGFNVLSSQSIGPAAVTTFPAVGRFR